MNRFDWTASHVAQLVYCLCAAALQKDVGRGRRQAVECIVQSGGRADARARWFQVGCRQVPDGAGVQGGQHTAGWSGKAAHSRAAYRTMLNTAQCAVRDASPNTKFRPAAAAGGSATANDSTAPVGRHARAVKSREHSSETFAVPLSGSPVANRSWAAMPSRTDPGGSPCVGVSSTADNSAAARHCSRST